MNSLFSDSLDLGVWSFSITLALGGVLIAGLSLKVFLGTPCNLGPTLGPSHPDFFSGSGAGSKDPGEEVTFVSLVRVLGVEVWAQVQIEPPCPCLSLESNWYWSSGVGRSAAMWTRAVPKAVEGWVCR